MTDVTAIGWGVVGVAGGGRIAKAGPGDVVGQVVLALAVVAFTIVAVVRARRVARPS